MPARKFGFYLSAINEPVLDRVKKEFGFTKDSNEINYIVYLFLITIMTDTFAYFIGRSFGKTKLLKDVSPNKTVEGYIGGLIFGTLIASLFYIFVIDTISFFDIILP